MQEKAYTKEGYVERFLERPLTANEKGLLHLYIPAATRLIDNHTNREYQGIDDTETPAAETRIYDGKGYKELFIHDFISISKIEFLDNFGNLYLTVPSTYFVFYPLTGSLKNSIHLRFYCFPDSKANVRITGVFTSGPVPKAVQTIATMLVANMLTKQKIIGSEFDSEMIEGYKYQRKTDETTADYDKILALIDSYRKIEF